MNEREISLTNVTHGVIVVLDKTETVLNLILELQPDPRVRLKVFLVP
tara:strand:- start:387 stop:527 length:141 start_codon:yes stop_codon:yes gene_type:complete